jgi:hypothetical protein
MIWRKYQIYKTIILPVVFYGCETYSDRRNRRCEKLDKENLAKYH